MKYLKRFNEGEMHSGKSNGLFGQDIIEDVKDITLELSHGPFNITHVHRYGDSYIAIENMNVYNLYDDSTDNTFYYSEIKPTMDRLFIYLGDNLKYIEVVLKHEGRYERTLKGVNDCENSVNNEFGNKEIRLINLYYTRL